MSCCQQGVSPRDTAVLTGVSLATVYRLLNGTHSAAPTPSLRMARRRLPPGMSRDEVLLQLRAVLETTTIVTPDGCWLTSVPGIDGTIRVAGSRVHLPRLVFEIFIGPPGPARVGRVCPAIDRVDADGHRLACWRPDHLRLASARAQPSVLDWRHRGRTACPRQHPLTLQNTRFRMTKAGTVTRACRRCARDRETARRSGLNPPSG